MKLRINYANIPILSIGFTGNKSITGAFLVSEDHRQLFATEETREGLRECSLEKYTYPSNKIIALYVWDGINNPSIRDQVHRFISEVRRRVKEDSLYKWKKYLLLIQRLKNLFDKNVHVENIPIILKTYGCGSIGRVRIKPEELHEIVKSDGSFRAIENFYF